MVDTPHTSRLRALQQALRSNALDAYVVLDRSNTFYLTGFTGTFSILLIGHNVAFFITDFRYIERARKSVIGYTVLQRKRTCERTISHIARQKGWKRIGFETTLAYGDLERLRSADSDLPVQAGIDFCPSPHVIEALRVTKDAAELGVIRRAAVLCDAVFLRIRRFVRPGISEKNIARKIRSLIESLGGEAEAFPTIVASGPNSSMPHHETGNRVLKHGDGVTIDLGVRLDGYNSDITRTFYVGSASRAARQIYQIVLQSQDRALRGIKPGVLAMHVDHSARSFIAQHGFGKYFGHGLGHGVGIDVHEPPYLKQGEKTALAPNMVVTVEPGIYVPGTMGVRIEDLVLVTDTGCEILTRTPKDLSAAMLRI